MNKKILKLAKECGSDDVIPNVPDVDGNFYMHYRELEAFYRAAFNAGLEAGAKEARSAWHDDAIAIADSIEALEMKP